MIKGLGLECRLVRPTVNTLEAIADHLGVLVLGLVTFPAHDERQAVTDAIRRLRPGALRPLRRDLGVPSKTRKGTRG